MPGRDGTGPKGMGSMTGRAAGSCVVNYDPECMFPGMGQGGGQGYGRRGIGRGMGHGSAASLRVGRGRQMKAPYQATQNRDQELEMLRLEANDFQAALKDIQQRIAELENAEPEKKQ